MVQILSVSVVQCHLCLCQLCLWLAPDVEVCILEALGFVTCVKPIVRGHVLGGNLLEVRGYVLTGPGHMHYSYFP